MGISLEVPGPTEGISMSLPYSDFFQAHLCILFSVIALYLPHVPIIAFDPLCYKLFSPQ